MFGIWTFGFVSTTLSSKTGNYWIFSGSIIFPSSKGSSKNGFFFTPLSVAGDDLADKNYSVAWLLGVASFTGSSTIEFSKGFYMFDIYDKFA